MKNHPVCIILGHVTTRGDSLVIGRIVSKRDGRSVHVLREVVYD